MVHTEQTAVPFLDLDAIDWPEVMRRCTDARMLFAVHALAEHADTSGNVGPTTNAELAALAGVQPRRFQQVVSSLENAGLIEKSRTSRASAFSLRLPHRRTGDVREYARSKTRGAHWSAHHSPAGAQENAHHNAAGSIGTRTRGHASTPSTPSRSFSSPSASGISAAAESETAAAAAGSAVTMEEITSWLAAKYGERCISLAKQLETLGIQPDSKPWNVRTLIDLHGPEHVRAQIEWARKHKPAGWLNAGKLIRAITDNWAGFDHERDAARRELAAVQARKAAEKTSRELERRSAADNSRAQGDAAIDACPLDRLREHVEHAIDKYFPASSGGLSAQQNARKKRDLHEGDEAAVRAMAKLGPVGAHLRLVLKGLHQ